MLHYSKRSKVHFLRKTVEACFSWAAFSRLGTITSILSAETWIYHEHIDARLHLNDFWRKGIAKSHLKWGDLCNLLLQSVTQTRNLNSNTKFSLFKNSIPKA